MLLVLLAVFLFFFSTFKGEPVPVSRRFILPPLLLLLKAINIYALGEFTPPTGMEQLQTPLLVKAAVADFGQEPNFYGNLRGKPLTNFEWTVAPAQNVAESETGPWPLIG